MMTVGICVGSVDGRAEVGFAEGDMDDGLDEVGPKVGAVGPYEDGRIDGAMLDGEALGEVEGASVDSMEGEYVGLSVASADGR